MGDVDWNRCFAREVLGGRNFGAKSGSLALFYLAGSATAPWLGSIIWGVGGYDLMLGVLVGVIAVGAVLYVTAPRLSGT